MKRTRPGCQLVAPSASQWDGKAFVLGGNLRSALCAAQAFCVHASMFVALGQERPITTCKIDMKKKTNLLYFTEIFSFVHHRTLSAL